MDRNGFADVQGTCIAGIAEKLIKEPHLENFYAIDFERVVSIKMQSKARSTPCIDDNVFKAKIRSC